ncbi:TetR/AcrR family transcriptional regulator [Candidatus Bipolaricaulota bacterium]|nr:TetR/AcrR family transcriptional regulator [Candidatus Bipolaricaulota bacterium]
MVKENEKDKKVAIREAATKIISRQGYFQTRPKDIASEAGVSVGTIYNYYDSKQEILVDIFAEELSDRKDFYRKLSRRDLPLVEQIKRILKRHFSRLSNHKELMRVIIQERFKPGSGLGNKLNQSYSEAIKYIEQLIEEAMDKDQIRPCDPRIVASALFGSVESTIAAGLLQDKKDQEEMFDQAPEELAKFFWNGLRKTQSKPPDKGRSK